MPVEAQADAFELPAVALYICPAWLFRDAGPSGWHTARREAVGIEAHGVHTLKPCMRLKRE